MFLDRRLGTGTEIPTARNIREIYYISNGRRLYLRLTSPHEYGENPEDFLEKARNKMGAGRWCFACALQPNAHNQMPDVVESVRQFVSSFDPECVRIAFLSPTRHGVKIEDFLLGRDVLSEVLHIPKVEAMCIDARRRGVNGLLLADFFDFT